MRTSDEKKSAIRLKQTVWIGKNGCTPEIVQEICGQIKTRKIVKIKWLKSVEIDPDEVAGLCNSRLILVRGKTMVLTQKRKDMKKPGQD